MKTEPKKLSCDHCTAFEVPKLSKAGPHIKAECSVCGNYVKFIPKHQEIFYSKEKEAPTLFKPSEVYEKLKKKNDLRS